jgi:undecaprenyl pyrophosphate synthase/G:T-mismatch repair DNA endonuclease (very short patch repair protein)
MNKTELFIEKAIKIHGDKYDYSKVEYINAKEKVIIICKIHGEFIQTPNKHLQNQNCSQCSKKPKLNMEEFIKRANIKYNNLYDYSKVNYINYDTKVTIICKIHGKFLQTPYKHLNYKYGCYFCNSNHKLNFQEFFEKSIKIHGDKYDYSKVEYINNHTKVTIICKIHGEFKQRPSDHYRYNCHKCSGKNLNTVDIINKFNIIHKNKYDYSKVNYINCSTKVTIICKIHGEWHQTYTNHKKGKGCPLCSRSCKNINSGYFIKRSIEVHGNKYDYSKVNYISAKDKVIIICKEHGEFNQTPDTHLRSKGCSKCSKSCKIIDTNYFIEKSFKIHGNKYDYSKVNYISAKDKVIIICKEHGEFIQTPDTHLRSNGCPKCSNSCKNIDTEYFINRSITIHGNKYDYSKTIYIHCEKKVIIICKEHGEFLQSPTSHYKNEGCGKCQNTGVSKSQIHWLEFLEKYYNINIQHMGNSNQEYKIKNTKWKADGYCKETNTIFEYHGSFWHGDPKIYKPDDMNNVSKRTMGTLYKRTINREQKIKELGYNLEVMWESDWNKINKNISILQKKFRTCKSLNLLV